VVEGSRRVAHTTFNEIGKESVRKGKKSSCMTKGESRLVIVLKSSGHNVEMM